MIETSPGKDTTTGHWEIAGVILDKPFPLYPDGFPSEVIDEFEKRASAEILGNVRGFRHRDHRAARARSTCDRQADRLHLGRQRLPDRRPRRRDPPGEALRDVLHRQRFLTGEHEVGRVIAQALRGGSRRISQRTARPPRLRRASTHGHRAGRDQGGRGSRCAPWGRSTTSSPSGLHAHPPDPLQRRGHRGRRSRR